MCLASFVDDSTKPPTIPRMDDVSVNEGAAVPKPCLSPVEMRMLTAAGGLLPAGTASTEIGTTFPRTLFSRSLGETKKSTRRTNNQLAPPC